MKLDLSINVCGEYLRDLHVNNPDDLVEILSILTLVITKSGGIPFSKPRPRVPQPVYDYVELLGLVEVSNDVCVEKNRTLEETTRPSAVIRKSLSRKEFNDKKKSLLEEVENRRKNVKM